MNLSGRLRRLDQKLGFRPKTYDLDETEWERKTKLWWFTPSLFVPLALIIGVEPGDGYNWVLVVQMLFGGLALFMSGFFYGERLRYRGKKSSIPALRSPDEVPVKTDAGPSRGHP